MGTPITGSNDNPDRDRMEAPSVTAAVVTGTPDDVLTTPFYCTGIVLVASTAPTKPPNGYVYFDGLHLNLYNGTAWVQLA